MRIRYVRRARASRRAPTPLSSIQRSSSSNGVRGRRDSLSMEKTSEPENDYRFGYRRTLKDDDLIVWLKVKLFRPALLHLG